jgi:hypothetical protein
MFIPPAGYPLSAYTPPELGRVPPPIPILADRISTVTGDVESLAVGVDPTDAALQWQFTIRQGEGAANGTNGARLHLITKATEQAPTQIADEGRRVVAKYVERGDIVDVVAVGGTPGGATAIAALDLRYHNVHTDRAQGLGGAR